MEHDIPFGNSNRENGTTFLDFPLFLGIFQWDESTKRVPFTAEPEIPEILTKWKAPSISVFTNFSHGIAVFNQFNLILRGNMRRPRIDRYNERKRYPTNFIRDYLSEIV